VPQTIGRANFGSERPAKLARCATLLLEALLGPTPNTDIQALRNSRLPSNIKQQNVRWQRKSNVADDHLIR
jgi:hypothetical protein